MHSERKTKRTSYFLLQIVCRFTITSNTRSEQPGEDSGTDKNAKESAKRDEDEKDRKAAEEKKKAAAQAAGSRPKAPRSMLPVNELDFELGTLIPGLNPNADGQEQENTN